MSGSMPSRCLVAALLAALSGAAAPAETIAPGVEFAEYSVAGPNRVFVTTWDRFRPEYDLMIGWPQGKRNHSQWWRTSEMFALYDNPPERDVIVATNGGFFGNPPDVIGPHASGGEMLVIPNPEYLRETILFGSSREPRIVDDIMHVNGSLRFANGSKTTLHFYNLRSDQVGDNVVCAYTPQYGPTTGTTVQGVEVILQDVSYPMRSDKEISGIVSAVLTGAASVNNAIPSGGMVIYARGAVANTIIQRTQVGDRLRMVFDTTIEAYNNADFAITGAGYIVRNGAPASDTWGQWSSSFTGVNPRTMLAWNETNFYLVVVDGRQPGYSVGMTFSQMADFLINVLQADEAINLDGGGSSTMVVNGVVRNSPSDATGERRVANSVLLYKRPVVQSFPFTDDFGADGREPGWDDKFRFNDVVAFSPTAIGGDGYVIAVGNPNGNVESIRRGSFADRDYTVEAWVYCDYRPDVAANGFERYGIFARDAGEAAFTSATGYGAGNCYALTYDSDDGRISAGVIVDGVLTDVLQNTPLYLPATAWRKFRLDCYGDMITWWVDGVKIATTEDTTHARGYFGIAHHELFQTNANARGTRVDRLSAFRLTPGDMDCDGVVEFGDIDVFVAALSYVGGEGWPYDCLWLNADVSNDGAVDFADIDAFVSLIGTTYP